MASFHLVHYTELSSLCTLLEKREHAGYREETEGTDCLLPDTPDPPILEGSSIVVPPLFDPSIPVFELPAGLVPGQGLGFEPPAFVAPPLGFYMPFPTGAIPVTVDFPRYNTYGISVYRVGKQEFVYDFFLYWCRSNGLTAYNSTVTITQLTSHMVAFCLDDQGSEIIKARLDPGDNERLREYAATPEEFLRLFLEIRAHLLTCCVNVHGCLVVQKFIQHGPYFLILDLADILKQKSRTLSSHIFGHRVLCALIESSPQFLGVGLMQGHLGRLIRSSKHKYESRVLIKCIEVLGLRRCKDIVRSAYQHISNLQCHKFGSHLVQKIIETEEYGDEEAEELRMGMMHLVAFNTTLLIDSFTHSSGNYVVQKTIEYGPQYIVDEIYIHVLERFETLPLGVMSSHIMQKIIPRLTDEQKMAMVMKLATEDAELTGIGVVGEASLSATLEVIPENPPSLFVRIATDRYGHYVMETLYYHLHHEGRNLINELITTHFTELEESSYCSDLIDAFRSLEPAPIEEPGSPGDH